MSITSIIPLTKNRDSNPIFQRKAPNASKWNGKTVTPRPKGCSKISSIVRDQFSLVANTRPNLDSRRITRIPPPSDPLEARYFICSALLLKERLKLFEKEVEVNTDLLTPKKETERRSQTFNEESALSIAAKQKTLIQKEVEVNTDLLTPKKETEQRSQTFNEESALSTAAKQKTPIQKELDPNSILKKIDRTSAPFLLSIEETTLPFTYADYEKTLSLTPTVEETLFSSLSSLYEEAKNYESAYQDELRKQQASLIEDYRFPETFLSNKKEPLVESLISLKALIKTAGRLTSQRSIGKRDVDTILKNIEGMTFTDVNPKNKTSREVVLKNITSMREKIEATLSIFIKTAELQLEKDLLRSLVFWKEGNQTKRILPDKIFYKLHECKKDINEVRKEKIRLKEEIESSNFWIHLLNSLKFLLFPYFILPGLLTKKAALMDSLEEVTQAEQVILKDTKSTFISFSDFQLFMKENKTLKETYWALKYLSQASGAIYSTYAKNNLGSKCPKFIKQTQPSSITYDSSSSSLLRKDSVFLKEMPQDLMEKNQMRVKELDSSLEISVMPKDFLDHTLKIDLEQIGKISPLQ